MKLADKISLSRIIMAPVFFLVYYFPFRTGIGLQLSAFILVPLLAVMELTDYFDGYYARKRGEVSDFGKLFDPFADVMAHLTAFLCFVVSGYMPVVMFLVIFFREYAMLFLRMMSIRKGVAVGASWAGKVKTVIYISSIIYALLIELFFRLTETRLPSIFNYVGYALFGIGMIASLVSFGKYVIGYIELCKSDDEKK